jgi:hypothetical protein
MRYIQEPSMKRNFTEKEARKLIGQSFVTRAPFAGVPLRSRGLVIDVLNSDDHWNVVIEWALPGAPCRAWYDKQELQNYMQWVAPVPL